MGTAKILDTPALSTASAGALFTPVQQLVLGLLFGFAPLPAFRHLSAEEYQEKVRALVREIEAEGVEALGESPGPPGDFSVLGLQQSLLVLTNELSPVLYTRHWGSAL